MMRLSLAPIGEINPVKAIWVEDTIRAILEEVGLTVDCEVCIVLKPYDDAFIVGVKDKRIAIGEEIARRIIV
ncbi:MAG: ferrous iron transport protein A [Clostridiales bacterium]|jgi:Fe2+ transport system protein FeoA|nr:ferrous iron transport protein A [Clostridiales bacterium]